MAERNQVLRRRTAELLTCEGQLAQHERQVASREEAVRSAQVDLCHQNDELEHGCANVLRREEQVTLRETDADITSLALDAREERVASQEADIAAREQAIKARAEQLEQSQIEVAAQRREIPTARGIPISATDGSSLEARLKNTEDELDTILSEQTNVKLMIRDILR